VCKSAAEVAGGRGAGSRAVHGVVPLGHARHESRRRLEGRGQWALCFTL